MPMIGRPIYILPRQSRRRNRPTGPMGPKPPRPRRIAILPDLGAGAQPELPLRPARTHGVTLRQAPPSVRENRNLYLPPAGHPRAVAGHLVIAEQRRRLGAHYLPDLAEHQADFLFGARVGARFDRVP